MESNFKALFKIMAPVKLKIAFAMLVSSIGSISLIFSLLFLSFALSSLMLDETLVLFGIELDFTKTIIVLTIMVIISFLTRLFSFLISHFAAFHLEEILRTNLSEHLAKLPLGYIIQSGSGKLKKVIQDDVRTLHSFVADSTPMIARILVAPILTMILLFSINYIFAFVAIFVLILGLIAMAFAMKDSEELRKKYEESQSNINKAVIQFVQAMNIVRTFDDGTNSFKRYTKALDIYKENLEHWMKISAFSGKLGMLILSPLPTLLAIFLSGIYLLNQGSLEFSSFITALFISTGMADSLMPLMWISSFVRKSGASAIRIRELLRVKTLEESKETKEISSYEIEFDKVFFKYEEGSNYALENVSFKVPQGSITALVGPSGAGKSTVAKLIPRFWDINRGSIKIGGVNIKELSNETLMNSVSFVFQDSFLFQDSLYNNIKIAKPEASYEEVIQASKAAQIHDFIQSLPKAYDTLAQDRGINLSGGQKQRITIARAILRNAPIIVLDEATAFADPENEEKIIQALANLTKNKTVIMIAHRLATIKDYDQIIVFDKAKIKEIGRHKELLENKSIYSDLWSNYEKASSWNLKLGEKDE